MPIKQKDWMERFDNKWSEAIEENFIGIGPSEIKDFIQETIEKCAKVAEDFAKDSFDEHEASACRVIASTIRKIGD